ncbi:MAG TPA: integrin [Flavobacteriaceae bacterium]|nr:integrin [Flavobacteriaceae bacterium]HIN98297.1 integrin [Flavobacteriaceae bacterium]
MLKYVFLLIGIGSFAQVGINTNDPKGSLHIESINNMGLVLPRVSNLDLVTDGQGGPPEEGTMIFNTSIPATCFYQNSKWVCIEEDASGNPIFVDQVSCTTTATYIKASNTDSQDSFSRVLSVSNDGLTLAVGATGDDSNASGINGNQSNNSLLNSGVVYIFSKVSGNWVQQAYIKASNPGAQDFFAISLSLSGDGNTLAVGAIGEDSNAIGINGNQFNNSSQDSGAVYVFHRSGSNWSQQAYIKSSNSQTLDFFGRDVSLSYNGDVLAVGADGEDSNATGINGSQSNNSAQGAGAVYIFNRNGSSWSQTTYIKASNPNVVDQFGDYLDIDDAGTTLLVGAANEDSSAVGINGNQVDNSALSSGAAYVFYHNGSGWAQEAYLKASNTEANDQFGFGVSVSGNGNVVAIGATGEDSDTTTINGDQFNNGAVDSGAIYIFTRTVGVWSQEAYVKSSNSNQYDDLGYSLALSYDGTTLLTGTYGEDGDGIGLCATDNNNANRAGAAYLFKKQGGEWSEKLYIKATNSEVVDEFGFSCDMTPNGSTMVIGAHNEGSNAIGINGDQTNNLSPASGAVYVFEN